MSWHQNRPHQKQKESSLWAPGICTSRTLAIMWVNQFGESVPFCDSINDNKHKETGSSIVQSNKSLICILNCTRRKHTQYSSLIAKSSLCLYEVLPNYSQTIFWELSDFCSSYLKSEVEVRKKSNYFVLPNEMKEVIQTKDFFLQTQLPGREWDYNSCWRMGPALGYESVSWLFLRIFPLQKSTRNSVSTVSLSKNTKPLASGFG